MTDPTNWRGVRDAYLSAVAGRVRLSRAFDAAGVAGDLIKREQIYPALVVARYAEEQCRMAFQRAGILNAIEEAA